MMQMNTVEDSRALKLREYSRRYYYRHRQTSNKESLEYAKVKAQVRTLGRQQQLASVARLRQKVPHLPPMVWGSQPQQIPSFKVQGLTKREKKQVKKRYQQYRRDLRRKLADEGGKAELHEERDRLERLSRMKLLVATDVSGKPCFSKTVEAHFREPAEPMEKEEAKHVCIECKERVEEGMAVQKHCMMFHAGCWEVVREGFFHRKRYLKCGLCGEKVRAEMV